MLTVEAAIEQLRRQAEIIQQMTLDVSDEQARWKPNPESWSILEVMNHLADEEEADFRVRLDHILHKPTEDWPPIDPQGWVTQRKYNERDLDETRSRFAAARGSSLQWLEGLDSPDLDSEVTSRFGSMKAGDMLAAWVVHDLLHIRQFTELHLAYTKQQAHPYDSSYSGE